MRFNGKVAVITAAASGICRAAAGIIVKEGGLVVGIDTDEARLKKCQWNSLKNLQVLL